MTFLSNARYGWLLALVTVAAGGGIGVACNGDSGTDGGPGDSGGDTTIDSPTSDGGGMDSAPVTCEAGVTGACDIVLQNCPSGKECRATEPDGGAWSTQCFTNTTGNLAEGSKCTPGGQNNPCQTGLECISDGVSGRCSKHCCEGDMSCGLSVPEGYQGSCDLGIELGQGTPFDVPQAYFVCDYLAPCQPFGIKPCGAGQICIVKDNQGDSKCTPLFGSGKPEKAGCTASNECASGLGCYGAPDGGGFTCQWNCYAPGGPGPFDAGIEKAGPGYGGCPTGEKCQMIAWGGPNPLPTWFGLCQ